MWNLLPDLDVYRPIYKMYTFCLPRQIRRDRIGRYDLSVYIAIFGKPKTLDDLRKRRSVSKV